jgi:hypothetical protein
VSFDFKQDLLRALRIVGNLFRSIWHRFDFPFGSYSFDISFRLRSAESCYSGQIYQENNVQGRIVVKSPDTDVLVLLVHYFPNMKNTSELWFQTGLITSTKDVSSLGGSLTKVESLTVSNFTRNLFRSIWHRFDFPFGSYSFDISFRPQVSFGFKQDLLRALRIVDVISLYTSYAGH